MGFRLNSKTKNPIEVKLVHQVFPYLQKQLIVKDIVVLGQNQGLLSRRGVQRKGQFAFFEGICAIGRDAAAIVEDACTGRQIF
jgi:hypothetical protein